MKKKKSKIDPHPLAHGKFSRLQTSAGRRIFYMGVRYPLIKCFPLFDHFRRGSGGVRVNFDRYGSSGDESGDFLNDFFIKIQDFVLTELFTGSLRVIRNQ